MAQRDRDGVAGVIIELAFRQLDLRGEHARDLRFVCIAITGEDDFDLTRLVLEHGNADFFKHVEDRAAGLRDAHRAGGIAAHEKFLDRRLGRWMLRDEVAQMIRDREQASAVPARDGDHGAASHDGIRFSEKSETSSGQARVDAQDQSVIETRHWTSTLHRDAFKDVGWNVEVGVNLLDVVVFLQ